MEGDFQRPSVHRFMQVDVPIGRGFSRQLHGHSEVMPWGVVACTPTLHVLAEGALRSPGMLFSKQFEQSVNELKSYYDIIVIDGPTVSYEMDCRALDSIADGLIIVCKDPGSAEVTRARPLFSEKRFFAMLPPAA
jgi:Mrp family chromosome partitioning ATPase